ncbi:PREDICTED: uncharacterized protein LOC109133342 [Camelina sativa]|uniref:Uncharacterized protein LOC109133342 n=1 Tax=Camelina sativa TaxID=90675 RepID=A0ABM1RSC7_CAMSA|nr:PREDICTED: uncharacterized protein LOC109133342 [Camelina sativa]
MVMEQVLTPVKELSTEEQASIEFYEQLSQVKTKLRTSDLQTKDQLELINSKIGSHEQMMTEINKKLEFLIKHLLGKETIQEFGGSSQAGAARSQVLRNQVPNSSLKPCRSEIRSGLRENLLRNVEMAIFEGFGIYGWIAKVERFFAMGGYNEAEKLALEMQELVHMQKPRDLPEVIAEARAMEGSIMSRVVKKELLLANKENKDPHVYEQRAQSGVNNNNRKTKVITTETTPMGDRQLVRSEPRPRRHNTNAELDEKRMKGICFKCDGPWYKDHKCPNRELRVLTVFNGFEVEVLDGIGEEETIEEAIGECMALSFSSYRGLSSSTTTKVRGAVGKEGVVIMLDSGATQNFISPAAVKKLKLKCRTNPNLNVRLGNGLLVNGLGVCENVTFSTQNLEFTQNFVVLELGLIDVILGVAWLSTLGDCRVNWHTNEMSFLYKGKTVLLRGEEDLNNSKMSLKSLSSNYTVNSKCVEVELCNHQLTQPTTHQLDTSIQTVLSNFTSVFAIPTSLPPIRGREHAINLIPGTTTISVRPYRYPHAQKEVMEKMVRDMLEAGIILPSQSPFSSPVLLVKKKDDIWCFCVDYRALNSATIPDKFPIPMIDQLLDELNRSVIFSKMDLRAGYHQIRMKEEDALMNELFRPYLRKFILVFFDDILIYSRNLDEHVEHLTVVLKVLEEHCLFANQKKCMFGQPQVGYLGHIITYEGVSTYPTKTQAMTKWVTPKSVKKLRGFLGLTGYYRRFIKGYGVLARPLTDLLRKDSFE